MAKIGSFGEVIPRGGRAVFTAYNKKIADDIAAKLAQPERHFEPSEYQQAIFDWVALEPLQGIKRNAMIEAVAGAGKTTTLVKICKLLNMQVSSATFHSIGLRAWQGAVGQAVVNGDKINDLMEELDIARHLRPATGKLVSLAKQRGIGIEGVSTLISNMGGWEEIIDHFDLDELIPNYTPREQVIGIAVRVLNESIAQASEVIDFEDMIYMPLYSGVAIPQFDWVLVDEYQDTNPTRRELARRMLAPSGRFVGVGDPHQAIYGFTGADNDAMEIGIKLFDCVRLPLTVTYRCPRAVVTHAQQWVSHIQAHPSAPLGVVRHIEQKEFLAVHCRPQRGFAPGLLDDPLKTTDAILCRNTRPLIELAFDLIKKRIPCHVEGRDIGQGLITLVKKWKSVRTIAQLRDHLEEWSEGEIRKFLKRGRKDKVASLEDKVGTLYVFMASLHDDDSTYKLIESINSLFKDTETGRKAATVTLSTVHKSKGREWPRVFLLGRNTYMPSSYAKKGWQLEQENNLIYVAVTRAMQELIEVRVPEPGEEQWEQDEELFSDDPGDVTGDEEDYGGRSSLSLNAIKDAHSKFAADKSLSIVPDRFVRDPVAEIEAFLAMHGIRKDPMILRLGTAIREIDLDENGEARLSLEEQQIARDTQNENSDERAYIREQEEMRANGMTDLSEEG